MPVNSWSSCICVLRAQSAGFTTTRGVCGSEIQPRLSPCWSHPLPSANAIFQEFLLGPWSPISSLGMSHLTPCWLSFLSLDTWCAVWGAFILAHSQDTLASPAVCHQLSELITTFEHNHVPLLSSLPDSYLVPFFLVLSHVLFKATVFYSIFLYSVAYFLCEYLPLGSMFLKGRVHYFVYKYKPRT